MEPETFKLLLLDALKDPVILVQIHSIYAAAIDPLDKKMERLLDYPQKNAKKLDAIMEQVGCEPIE